MGFDLQRYVETLDPVSILEVIPKDILQSLMQGSFYKERAGLTLIYDDATYLRTEPPHFLRLEPFDGRPISLAENYSPFCKLFRQHREQNQLCVECDSSRTMAVYQ